MAENIEKTEKKMSFDEKVSVVNIAPWSVGFPNKATVGDTLIPASGTVRIRREEIISQVNMNNKLFVGLDGKGSHATLFVDDEATRNYLEFDEDKRTQNVINRDKVQKWFELKTQSSFEKNITENVKTRAEKQFLLKTIKDLKLNDYEKIIFCQEYCKFTLRGI